MPLQQGLIRLVEVGKRMGHSTLFSPFLQRDIQMSKKKCFLSKRIEVYLGSGP